MKEYKRTTQKKLWHHVKGKKKEKINKEMYRKFLEYYLINAHMPTAKEIETICINKYECLLSQSIWIEYEKFEKYFYNKVDNYEERILQEIESGMTLEKLNYKKTKKTEKQKIKERRKKRKVKKERELYEMYQDQDETYYYIAGYTSGGAPYGITWEELEITSS